MSEEALRTFVVSSSMKERRGCAPVPRNVQLPRCETCRIRYHFYVCGCYGVECPVWAANEASCTTCIPSEYRDGQPEPTTIPTITATLRELPCSKFDCVRRCEKVCQNEGPGGQCKTTISVYACGDVKIETPHLCIWCNSTYAQTRPQIELKIHTVIGGVCDNYSQHEHYRRKRERERERGAQIEASNERDIERKRVRANAQRRWRQAQKDQEPRAPPSAAKLARDRYFSLINGGSASPRDSGSSPSHNF